MERITLWGLNEEVLVDMEQEPIFDEETEYNLYETEDGRLVAMDEAIGEWVQVGTV